MLTVERHDHIRAKLAASGRVIAAELATEFGVSDDTVRRDLRELARAGECRRVYGGALLPAPDLGSIARREDISGESKQRLAVAVAGLFVANETVFIDAGSTNLAVARAVLPGLPLHVVTNAPAVALALAERPQCHVTVLGGAFNAQKGACLGASCLRDIARIRADRMVLGSCGVDAGVGVSALDEEEAEVKRAMVQQSGSVIVAATEDKLGTAAPFIVMNAERIDVLVVNRQTDALRLAPFQRLGTTVVMG